MADRVSGSRPLYAITERFRRPTGGRAIPAVPRSETAYTPSVRREWKDALEKRLLCGGAIGFLPRAKRAPWMVAFEAK